MEGYPSKDVLCKLNSLVAVRRHCDRCSKHIGDYGPFHIGCADIKGTSTFLLVGFRYHFGLIKFLYRLTCTLRKVSQSLLDVSLVRRIYSDCLFSISKQAFQVVLNTPQSSIYMSTVEDWPALRH